MNQFLFGTLPYIALTVLLIGSIARYERDPYTWKSKSSQLLRRKQLALGSVLFHVGVLVIFFGHLFGLLIPIQVYEALGIAPQAKQLLAALAGGAAGLVAITGALILAHRRLLDPRVRATSSFADTGILLLLIVQLALGLISVPISLADLSDGGVVHFMNWAFGIFTFNAHAASNLAEVNIIFKIHIVLGLTIFILFPFTRLVHMLSAPIRYVWRPGYQIVRTRREKA
ncbi:MAG TPA: respiratory nitrate reductase subunit gamma [Gammaproteobacteria bacterium]|nr:respiratory nitrate reductase subunit gamma [Gammaproteobacteria bacterium]